MAFCTEHHNMTTNFCPDCGDKLRPGVIRVNDQSDQRWS